MADRVEVDPDASVGRRLVLVDACAGGDDDRLGVGDVRDREVPVHLLRVAAARPGGSIQSSMR